MSNEPLSEELISKQQLTNAKTPKRRIILTPVVTTVLAAVFGLIGTGIGALAQGWFNRQLERDKFEFSKQIERQQNEANLVLKVVETGDPEKAKTNLLFLVKAGFIQDPDGRISALANDTTTVPVLPKASRDSAPRQTVDVEANASRSGEQSYKVGNGDVYLEVMVGFGLFGKYTVTLWDNAGENPQRIGEGTTGGPSPREFKIGSGSNLAGRMVTIQTMVTDPSGKETFPVSVQYKFRGGPAAKVFNVSGNATGGTASYFNSIKLRG